MQTRRVETAEQTTKHQPVAGITFACEPYSAATWNPDMMMQHWRELGHSPDVPLTPNFAAYEAVNKAGLLKIYTARVDGLLVGYAIYMLGPDLFVADRMYALQNVLFIEYEYRRGWTLAQLMKFANRDLVEGGVTAVNYCCNARAPGLSLILERLGARKEEEVWTMRMRGK